MSPPMYLRMLRMKVEDRVDGKLERITKYSRFSIRFVISFHSAY